MTQKLEMLTIEFLRRNIDVFAWEASNFQGINPEVIAHRLNVDQSTRLVRQKKRSFGVERNKIIEQEVETLLQVD